MAACVECEGWYSDKRAALGYETCLTCGEVNAQRQIVEKSTRIIPAGNKMGYTLLSANPEIAKSEARGYARKTEER